MPYNFGPADVDEPIVFGCARPMHGGLDLWAAFMKDNGIRRVCCLLPGEEELVADYRRLFSPSRVLHAPIGDFQYAEREQLVDVILPFLWEAAGAGERVVAHCWAGSGRTGHVLAAWLVAARGVSITDAPLRVVDVPDVRRNPYEAESDHRTLDEVLGWALRTAKIGGSVAHLQKRIP